MNAGSDMKHFRGNQDTLLGYIRQDPDYEKICKEYLSDQFLGIDQLLGFSENPRVQECISVIAQHFKIKNKYAEMLVLSHPTIIEKSMGYLPKITGDIEYVYIRVGPKTTIKDVTSVWHIVKEHQKKIGGVGSKGWSNTKLAYCIYRQRIIEEKPMAQVYEEYIDGRLEGYDAKPTIFDINDFRKYYDSFIKGILNP